MEKETLIASVSLERMNLVLAAWMDMENTYPQTEFTAKPHLHDSQQETQKNPMP